MDEKKNNSLPAKKFCNEHQKDARLTGWDSDGYGIYACPGPELHGLLEDGSKIAVELTSIFGKL